MPFFYPKELLALISQLKKLPGVGNRTAERFAFHLLKWKEAHLLEFANLLENLKKNLRHCESCGCLMGEGSCRFCDLKSRNSQWLCIVSSPKDIFSIEETKVYKGLYHVIEHLISPLEDRHIDPRHIEALKRRISSLHIQEVIIALDSTLEGDATALFLKAELQPLGVRVSRLAFGLPLGSSLEYVDGGTLSKALMGRQNF